MRDDSGYVSSATFTPAAAAYSAVDVMDAAKEFVKLGPTRGAEVKVETVEFEVDTTGLQASEATYRLYLYSVTPPSAIADNGAWDLPSGDRASFRGYIDLLTPVDLGSTLYVKTISDGTHLSIPAGGSLFGYLVTIAGFTATAVARKVTLHTVARVT